MQLPAHRAYMLLRGLSRLFFLVAATFFTVYLVLDVRLNPLQIVLVGTALEVSYFLAEIPTGVVADVVSRRLSVVIGLALTGVGFMLTGALARFETILLAQVVLGVGEAFRSGADSAWIADELRTDDASIGKVFLRGTQVAHIGGLVGIVASIPFGIVNVRLPIIAGGFLLVVLAGFLLVTMPEHGFTRHERAQTWASMRRTLAEGLRTVRARPALVSILAIALFYGMSEEVFDRLWEVHILDAMTLPSLGGLKPIAWFGILDFVATVLGILTAEAARRRIDLGDHHATAKALRIVDLALLVTVVAFGLSTMFIFGASFYWLTVALRNTHDPIHEAWVNQGLDPSVRATVLSMSGQAHSVGEAVGGPLLAVVALLTSPGAGMIGAGVILLPVFLFYGRETARSGDGSVKPVDAQSELA